MFKIEKYIPHTSLQSIHSLICEVLIRLFRNKANIIHLPTHRIHLNSNDSRETKYTGNFKAIIENYWCFSNMMLIIKLTIFCDLFIRLLIPLIVRYKWYCKITDERCMRFYISPTMPSISYTEVRGYIFSFLSFKQILKLCLYKRQHKIIFCNARGWYFIFIGHINNCSENRLSLQVPSILV